MSTRRKRFKRGTVKQNKTKLPKGEMHMLREHSSFGGDGDRYGGKGKRGDGPAERSIQFDAEDSQ